MNKFIKGSSILMIGDLLTKIISVLYLIPLTRIDNTIILLMTNLLVPFGFFVVFSTIGINIVLTNELVKAKDLESEKKILLNVGVILTILTIVGALLMLLASNWLMHTIEANQQYANTLTKGSRILTIGVLLFSLTSYLRAILLSLGHYKIISITFITEQILKVSIILIGSYYFFVLNNYNIVNVVYLIVFGILVSMISTLLAYIYHFLKIKYFSQFKGIKYKFSNKHAKYLIASSLILFAGGIYLTLFDQIDLLLLNKQMLNIGIEQKVIDNVKSEYFTLSMKIVMVPITISASFITVMIKHIGESKDNKKEFNNIIYIVSIFSIFMMSAIILMGRDGYQFLYSEKSYGIITLQAIIIPIYITKNVIGGYVITNKGKYKSIIYSTVVIIILKIILDLILFNYFKYYAYILASSISLIIGTAMLILMNKNLFINIKKTFTTNLTLYIKGIILILVSAFIYVLLPHINNLFLMLIVQFIIFIILFTVIYLKKIKSLIKN